MVPNIRRHLALVDWPRDEALVLTLLATFSSRGRPQARRRCAADPGRRPTAAGAPTVASRLRRASPSCGASVPELLAARLPSPSSPSRGYPLRFEASHLLAFVRWRPRWCSCGSVWQGASGLFAFSRACCDVAERHRSLAHRPRSSPSALCRPREDVIIPSGCAHGTGSRCDGSHPGDPRGPVLAAGALVCRLRVMLPITGAVSAGVPPAVRCRWPSPWSHRLFAA